MIELFMDPLASPISIFRFLKFHADYITLHSISLRNEKVTCDIVVIVKRNGNF